MSRCLMFPETGTVLVRADETQRIATHLKGSGMPLRLYVPKEHREGFEIAGLIVMNQRMEVPFFIRSFHAPLFDGDETRQSPYGALPLVPVDADTDIFLEVHNRTLEDREFRAEMIVLEPGTDYEEKR